MSNAEPSPTPAPLPDEPPAKIDFEHAELPEAVSQHVTCGICKRPIDTEYWQSLGKVLCPTCREIVARTAADARGGAALGKAALLGGGAALGCGIGYAIFVGVTNIQFALVTIGIGWVIGRAIQKVTRGFGSTRHQVLAVALTYFASCMGYVPAIFKGFRESAAEHRAPAKAGATAAPSTAQPAPETSPASEAPAASPATTPGTPSQPGLAFSLFVMVALTTAVMLAAPFFSIAEGFSGILGLLIIFFGLRTAWRVSRGVEAVMTGPHRIKADDASRTG